eukprot:5498189-Prymnesium_polylepis.1
MERRRVASHVQRGGAAGALRAVEARVDALELVRVVGVEGDRVLVLDAGLVGVRDDDVFVLERLERRQLDVDALREGWSVEGGGLGWDWVWVGVR